MYSHVVPDNNAHYYPVRAHAQQGRVIVLSVCQFVDTKMSILSKLGTLDAVS